LSVLAALRDHLPNAPVIYAADFAGLPYGKKSEAEVTARVCGLLGRMSERYTPRAICIACNTASTIALSMVRDVLEVPIVGTVPAIKPAAAMTRTGVIGLLGTEATVRQPYVDRLEAEFAQGKRLIRFAAPGLVNLAEAKLRGTVISASEVEREIAGLIATQDAANMDTLVLACTHFPLLADELSEVFGDPVQQIHGAQGIARQIAAVTQGQEFAREEEDFAAVTLMTDCAPAFARYGITDIREF
jgi:glutamate racemase